MKESVSLADISSYAAQRGISMREAVRDFLLQGRWPSFLLRNSGLLSLQTQLNLLELPIFIAGCGGLGGEMAAHLVHLGAGDIILCDYDSFDETNLNRQRFCDTENLGVSKAAYTAKALSRKAPWGIYRPVEHKLELDTESPELEKCQLVIDCLDSVTAKKMLEKLAERVNAAWLYGAVLHHEGFACLKSDPGPYLEKLYGAECSSSGAGSVLSHVVSGTASLMCSLLLKWLENPAYNSPLLHMDFSIPDLNRFELN